MPNRTSRSAGIGGTRKFVFSWLKNPKPEESILIRAERDRNFTVTVQPRENAISEDTLRESDDLVNNGSGMEVKDEFHLEQVQFENDPIDEKDVDVESMSLPRQTVISFGNEKSQFSISVARCYFNTNTVVAKYIKGEPVFEGKTGKYFFKTILLLAKALMFSAMKQNLMVTVDGKDSNDRAIVTEVSIDGDLLSDETRELLSKLISSFKHSDK